MTNARTRAHQLAPMEPEHETTSDRNREYTKYNIASWLYRSNTTFDTTSKLKILLMLYNCRKRIWCNYFQRKISQYSVMHPTSQVETGVLPLRRPVRSPRTANLADHSLPDLKVLEQTRDTGTVSVCSVCSQARRHHNMSAIIGEKKENTN